MSWLDDMHADALALAAPERVLDPDETVRVEVEWDDGYHYSEYTYENPHFEIEVWIDQGREDGESRYVAGYRNDEASEFFQKLMSRGSKT